MMHTITLYIFSALAIFSVVAMLLSRLVFHAALALLSCLISLAVIYGLLNAEFLAITQLIIYAGGVLVIILFGIMLTNRIAGKPLHTENQHTLPGVIIFIGFMSMFTLAFLKTDWKDTSANTTLPSSINHVGVELMSTYVAPFEIGGLLLLICLVGAALTASVFKKDNHE